MPPKVNILENKKNIKGLIKCFSYKKNHVISLQAVYALARLGSISLEPLKKAVTKKDEAIHTFSVMALGLLGEQSITEELIHVASTFYYSDLGRLSFPIDLIASKILAAMGNIKAIMLMLTAFNRVDLHIDDLPREEQLLIDNLIKKLNEKEQLSFIENELIPGLAAKDMENVYYQFWFKNPIRIFQLIGEPAVDPLIKIIRKQNKAVIEMGKEYIMEIMAVTALGMIGSKKAAAPIKEWTKTCYLGLEGDAYGQERQRNSASTALDNIKKDISDRYY